MKDVKLGQLVSGKPGRDAIHIAIAPVVAAWKLEPGAHVGLNSDGYAVTTPKQYSIGIVDPFLSCAVESGETFWLCLKPNTITSLRHDWSHPSFKDRDQTKVEGGIEMNSIEVKSSIQWIGNFADTCGINYNTLMNGADRWIQSDDYLVHGRLLYGESVPDEFWDHYETVKGIKVPSHKKESFFSCSC